MNPSAPTDTPSGTSAAGYYWNGALQARKPGIFCPERPERATVLMPERIFGQAGIAGRAMAFEARDSAILAPVHEPAYVDFVRTAHARRKRYLDAGETEVTADLYDQALLSASAGCAALDDLFAGRVRAAFCAVRPPGHHANRLRALGFCIFNNAAVAAMHARLTHGIARVLVLDWDVHPGNGTQEIFYEDPAVFTLSVHQADLFPEAGREDLTGRGAGLGASRNVTVPPGASAESYLARFTAAVETTVAAFRPELLILSAGFDAHRDDPASNQALLPEHFAEMTRIALHAAAPHTGGRTLSLLEGGYNLSALVDCVVAHYMALHEMAGA